MSGKEEIRCSHQGKSGTFVYNCRRPATDSGSGKCDRHKTWMKAEPLTDQEFQEKVLLKEKPWSP